MYYMSKAVTLRIPDHLFEKIELRRVMRKCSQTEAILSYLEESEEPHTPNLPELSPIHPKAHINPLNIPGVSLGKDFVGGNWTARPERNQPSQSFMAAFHAEPKMCPYREYSGDIGEWVQCGKAEHGPKIKHGEWKKAIF